MRRLTSQVIPLLFVAACFTSATAPQKPTDPGDLVTSLDEMIRYEAAPGEILHIVEGQRHGFHSLTVLITETKPGSGAPPHRHKVEEASILLKGKVKWTVGNSSFVAEGPAVIRVPAGEVHSFVNVGPDSINSIGVFPKSRENEIEAD